ncbi:MAG: hypothetical protein WC455_06255 [Dehalococcoidia bacterium]|jgi:hypothetical protein
MKKYTGLILIVAGIFLVALALIWGFKSSEEDLLAEGYTFTYHVTYDEGAGEIIDTSTYTMVVESAAQIDGKDCYFIDLSVQNEDEGKTGAVRTARTGVNTSINTSVISGDMWVFVDSFDLAKKQPVSLIYGNETYTTLTYTYNGSHGAPWEVGKTWTYTINVSSTTGQQYQIPGTATVVSKSNVSVPAGTFIGCYIVEYTTIGSTAPSLIEWWSDDIGMWIKMVDYSSYTGIETRALESYNLD